MPMACQKSIPKRKWLIISADENNQCKWAYVKSVETCGTGVEFFHTCLHRLCGWCIMWATNFLYNFHCVLQHYGNVDTTFAALCFLLYFCSQEG